MADSLLKTIDGWLSHESHSLASYYYVTIKDNNNATAMGLSTMVISQKAPVVEHCGPGYACELVAPCVFLPPSSIDATQEVIFPLHSKGKFSQRWYKGIFMM